MSPDFEGGFNEAVVVGNLGRDPDIRTTSRGSAILTLTVATETYFVEDDGGRGHKHLEWVECTVFGRNATSFARGLKKGSRVMVRGQLRTRDYTDRAGRERQRTGIVAVSVVDLDAAQRPAAAQRTAPAVGLGARPSPPRAAAPAAARPAAAPARATATRRFELDDD